MMLERLAPEQFDTIPEIPEPAENPVLVGHGEAAAMLASAHRSGRLHHGLLLSGPQGIGKATLAFHLAYHLLKHPEPANAPAELQRPDPASSLYRQIATGAHPSVLHLTRPMNDRTKSFKTAVTVDEIRKVSRFLSMTAHDGGYRVVIVDPADDMNRQAANALLKNLEEPPARTLFILIAHSPGGLLPTIRSRCQLIRLHPLGLDEVAAALKALRPDLASLPEAELARARGSVRNALLGLLYGGNEIAGAMQDLLAARDMDITQLYRLAEAVSARDAAIQFAIFNQRLLEHVATAARAAAEAGQGGHANRLAEFWSQAAEMISDTETYNLDKKQHVVELMERSHAALHAAA